MDSRFTWALKDEWDFSGKPKESSRDFQMKILTAVKAQWCAVPGDYLQIFVQSGI